MMFNTTAFAVVLVVGLVLAFIFLHIVDSIERTNTNKIDEELQVLAQYRQEIDSLKHRIEVLENQVKSLRVDVDLLHDAIIEDLNEPVRRGDS